MPGILDYIDAPESSLLGMLNMPSSQGFGDVPKDKDADAKALWAQVQAQTDQDNADAQRRSAAGMAAASNVTAGITPPAAPGSQLPAIDPTLGIKMALGQAPQTPFGSLAPAAPQAVAPAPVQGPIPLSQPRPATPMPGPQPPVAAPVVKPAEDQAALPPNATPTSGGPLPQANAAPAPQQPGLGDRLNGFIDTHRGQLMAMAGGLAGAPSLGAGIGRGFTAAAAALPFDQKQQLLTANNTALVKALQDAKVPSHLITAALTDPDIKKSVIDSYVADRKMDVVHQKDASGNERILLANPYDGSQPAKDITPAGSGGSNAFLAPGIPQEDKTLTGDAYMAQYSPDLQAMAKAYINGDIMPTGNPRIQGLQPKAKEIAIKWGMDTGVPVSDATYSDKRKMRTDLGSSGNSSMGGILSNGQSAFSHLAELGDSMSGLGNASHDFPTGGTVAAVQNYLGNKTFAGSDTSAKIKAINDNLGHYGQESTKFYSGTGGGIEERMNALKEMSPATTSSEEMAAYLEKEKSLMMDRMQTKFAQIKQSLGEDQGNIEIQKKLPDLQKNIDRIDTNIAKLRGNAPAQAAPAAASVTATGPDGHKIALQNGHWVDAQTGHPVQ